MYEVLSNEDDDGLLPEEIESLTSQLEIGIAVTVFAKRNRQPEKRTLLLKKETRQIVWYKEIIRRNVYEGTILLRDVKEIRTGKNSADFDKFGTEQTCKFEEHQCFTFFYGQRFNLKTLSISVAKDCGKWVELLRHLTRDTIASVYPLTIERWLWREYFNMTTDKTTVSTKDLKSFFQYVNLYLNKLRLREASYEVTNRLTDEFTFEEFSSLFQNLLYDDYLYRAYFHKYSTDGRLISVKDFQAFAVHQGDDIFEKEDVAIAFMRQFVRDSRRAVAETIFFTPKEFMSYLFSHHNELWDSQYNNIDQEQMTQPLSSYWIASSHNTYLTGNQYSSSSSVETYARCLQQGCRCVELDCWDGPDGMPIITHGRTMTSEIRFIDVLKIIKDHAFTTSPYPVILSIEDHCSLAQQRNMAKTFEQVLGSMLLTSPVGENEKTMPSPHELQGKIIIKHKKLPEGVMPSISVDESLPAAIERPDEMGDLGVSNTDKNGVLYLNRDDEWLPFIFFLSEVKLVCTKFQPSSEAEDGDEDGDEDYYNQPLRDGNAEYELHFSEEWFHDWRGQPSRLTYRVRAEALLRQHGPLLGDGTFLIRNSDNFVGDFTLSFWLKGKIEHFRIKRPTKIVDDRPVKFYQIEAESFDNLYNLIAYYKINPILCRGTFVLLNKPIPQPCPHEGELWYHPNISGPEAAKVLGWVGRDGAFLVRPSEQESGTFSISFRVDGKVKHCRIKKDGRLFVIGTTEFPDLVQLINFHKSTPLYGKVKLRYPVTELEAKMSPEELELSSKEYVASSYMDSPVIPNGVVVRALRDCLNPKNSEELCFPKDAIIMNVKKEDDDWWRGDYEEQKQLVFQSDCVQEIEMTPELLAEIEKSLEAQQDSYDLTGAVVEIEPMNLPVGRPDSPTGSIRTDISSISLTEKPAPEWLLRIKLPSQIRTIDFGVQTEEEAKSWSIAIENAVQRSSDLENMHRKIESSSRVAKELSDMVVYCRTKSFNKERIQESKDGRNHYEMSSFAEEKAERMMQNEYKFFLWYHQVMFSRIYPKGTRVDSSNYNPVPFWNVGSQIVALNYQTPDKNMQINEGKFMQNGKCGYVLKPKYILEASDYDPFYSSSSLNHEDAITVIVKVIAARHLPKSKRGIASPCVEVEIIGNTKDSTINKTKTITDNGFNPFWNECFEFKVTCPSLALLRFAVYDTDKFSDTYRIAQATYPVLCLRRGYRSIPLKNNHSDLLEMSSLLVYLETHNNRLVDIYNDVNLMNIRNDCK